jgi:predicted MFS family arabinose efflux permease
MVLIVPLAFGLREGSKPLPASSGPISYRAALREAFTHQGFILITASFFVCGFHVNLISTHLPAFLTDRGMSLNVAATALALVGLFNIFGSLYVGFLGGKYRQPYLLAGIYGVRTMVFLAMLLLPMSPTLALVSSAAMGFLYLSTAAPTTAMIATIFGPKHFSMIFGFVFGSHQLGGFVGAWLGGRLFDATGSYDAVWWMAVGMGVIATLLACPIRDQPIQRPVPV